MLSSRSWIPRSESGRLRHLLAPALVAGLLLSLGVIGAAQQPGQPARRAPAPPRDTPAADAAALPAGRIAGVVRIADTGRPLKRARVFISAPQLSDGRGALTDDEGGFSFDGLPEGRYSITVSKSGFVSLSYGQRRPLQPGTPLQLADGQELKGIEFRLPRGSVIAGHVFDDSGEPLPGANVRLMRYQFAQGQRQLVPLDATQTDDRGYYRIWGLNPGEYFVSALSRSLNVNGRGAPPATPAAAPGRRSRGAGAIVPAAPAADAGAATEPVGYAPTFFPGVPSVAEATPVTVGLGVERGDVDFALLLVRTSRVSGHVTGPDGIPTSSGNVSLIPEGSVGGRGGSTFGSRIEWDGVFRIANVPPGRYTLRARADDTVSPHYASQPLTVSGAEMPDLTIVLAPAATISGTVTVQSSRTSPPDLTQIRIVAPATEGGNVGPNANVRADRDGRFTLEGVPAGSHLIRAQGLERGWTLKSVLVEGREVIDTPIDLRSGATLSGVSLVISDRLTEVNGTVKDGRGVPFTEYTVLAFPDDPTLWRPQARHILTGRPDQNGRFQLRGLPPGDYLLTTIDPTEPGEWFDPGFLEPLRAVAIRITLGDGEVKTHDFTLPR